MKDDRKLMIIKSKFALANFVEGEELESYFRWLFEPREGWVLTNERGEPVDLQWKEGILILEEPQSVSKRAVSKYQPRAEAKAGGRRKRGPMVGTLWKGKAPAKLNHPRQLRKGRRRQSC
jgi:hypothetical protein